PSAVMVRKIRPRQVSQVLAMNKASSTSLRFRALYSIRANWRFGGPRPPDIGIVPCLEVGGFFLAMVNPATIWRILVQIFPAYRTIKFSYARCRRHSRVRCCLRRENG